MVRLSTHVKSLKHPVSQVLSSKKCSARWEGSAALRAFGGSQSSETWSCRAFSAVTEAGAQGFVQVATGHMALTLFAECQADLISLCIRLCVKQP